MPAMVRLAAVLRVQVPPELARVTVTVVPEAEPVALQLAKPLVRPIVGVGGMMKPDGKTTVMVLPAPRAPLPLGVKPTVQVAGADAYSELPLNVTLEGEVAAEIVTGELGLAAEASELVATLKVLAR